MEGLTPDKRDWLWSQKSDFWEYLGVVYEAYARSGNMLVAEAFARSFLEDPASPPENLPPLGISLARCLMSDGRVVDSLYQYARMAKVAPTHPLCAEAWYWSALVAYKQGNMHKVNICATNIRISQGAMAGTLDQWDLDARAYLLTANLDLAAIDPQATNYSTDYFHKQLHLISQDLEKLA